MSDSKAALTAHEAKALLEDDKRARVQTCDADIKAVLEAQRCVLDVVVLLSARGVEPQVRILALD